MGGLVYRKYTHYLDNTVAGGKMPCIYTLLASKEPHITKTYIAMLLSVTEKSIA